jgi:hypothetical protein
MNLQKISKEINGLLEKRRKKLKLNFIEEEHIYHMLDGDGNLRNDYLSVSKLVKKFYEPFDADSKSLELSKGDLNKQKQLLEQWKSAGDYSVNMGSRVHYELEKYLIEKNNNYKEVRKPIFEIDEKQKLKSNMMIEAGKKFLSLMEERKATLLDTEIVLGDPELAYVGQPDKIWLMANKTNDNYGIVITDWKTNQPKNFEVKPYTKKMFRPFETYDDTALSHYYLQLPLYGKLFLKMLENTKYSDLKLLGCVVVLLKDDGNFVEYKVPQSVNKTIMELNINQYTKLKI